MLSQSDTDSAAAAGVNGPHFTRRYAGEVTRALRAVSGAELPPALRAALAGHGPALFAGSASDLPGLVAHNVALVVQSSGSTARPKRVALSADALLASAAAAESALGGAGQWVLALPTTYIAGLSVLVRSICADTEPIAIDGHFDTDSFVRAAARLEHPLRFTSLVPAQLATLLENERSVAALRRFDRVLLGGQATPPPLLARALAEGVRVTRTYGSSETAGGCVYDGTPVGTTRARVVNGQVELAGPTLAEGYLDDQARTDAAFYSESGTRWYRTGDLGSIDEPGVLTVTGRLDDVIVSGGVNVSLGELEQLLRRATPLYDAVVVAADDEKWGQVPVVVSTVGVDLDELRSVVAAALGVASAPARVVVVDGIPLVESGKPDRLALRALAAR